MELGASTGVPTIIAAKNLGAAKSTAGVAVSNFLPVVEKNIDSCCVPPVVDLDKKPNTSSSPRALVKSVGKALVPKPSADRADLLGLPDIELDVPKSVADACLFLWDSDSQGSQPRQYPFSDIRYDFILGAGLACKSEELLATLESLFNFRDASTSDQSSFSPLVLLMVEDGSPVTRKDRQSPALDDTILSRFHIRIGIEILQRSSDSEQESGDCESKGQVLGRLFMSDVSNEQRRENRNGSLLDGILGNTRDDVVAEESSNLTIVRRGEVYILGDYVHE